MTNPENSDESRLDRIERLVEANAQQIEKLSTDLADESKKWDERFFQLSRDTLNFSRNIIVTAAVVAVLAPILRDTLAVVFQLLMKSE
jgi:MerR family transcriptional regulator, repressor of the yfmOP operon